MRPFGPLFGIASLLATGGAFAEESSGPPEEKSAEKQFVLPTVHVEGEAEPYRTGESGLARVAAPLVDTPQSVTVVPEKVIQEQRATTVRDALRNVSGITVSAGEGGRQGDTFNLRGFSGQTDVFRDGVRDLGWFTRDTFNLGGVEVFYGPSSVLFGRGSTGGAVNLLTRKPVSTTFSEVSLSGGTEASGRLELDTNQALSKDFQLRISGAGQLAGVAGRSEATENRAGIAPAARLQLGERTVLEVDYLYQHEDSVPDYGHPYFAGAPVSTSLGVDRSAFYGLRGSDDERVNAHVGTARITHDFGGLLSNTLRFGRVDRFARVTAPRGLAPADQPTSVGRQRFETETDNTYLINQTDLRGELTTGPLEHALNAGLELSRETRDQSRYNLPQVGASNPPADLFTPDPTGSYEVNRTFANDNQTQQLGAGLYASDQVKITKYLEVLGSARFDLLSTDYQRNAPDSQTDVQRLDRMFNWRAGLVIHPLERTSLYGLYGTSSNPTAEAGTLTDGSETLDPEQNRIIEVGAKADLFEDRLSLSGSAFRIDKLNARVPNLDPEGPPQVLDGMQRVEGFNVGAAGTIWRRWQAFANYTLMNSRILEHSNPYLVGQPLPNTPKHSLSLWTTVEVIRGLRFGGGAVYQSEFTVNNPSSETAAFNRVPGYWRFDAFASYIWGPAEFQLNLNNLGDALFYAQTSGGHAVPAPGRSANLTARMRF
ncbi:MAG: TonB-dependent siderophore receptor [Myxococcaceae bacterium]